MRISATPAILAILSLTSANRPAAEQAAADLLVVARDYQAEHGKATDEKSVMTRAKSILGNIFADRANSAKTYGKREVERVWAGEASKSPKAVVVSEARYEAIEAAHAASL